MSTDIRSKSCHTIAILGAGRVGTTLGTGFARSGHRVIYGVRNPDDRKHAALRETGVSMAPPSEAVSLAEIIVLAVPWAASEAVLAAAGPFDGKPLLDATNPIGPGFTLTHGREDSGAESIQRQVEDARVVKIFNTTGVENMASPKYPDGPLTMFLCGDDRSACELAASLASDLGFEPVRVGPLERARLLEPTAMLWIRMATTEGFGRDFGLRLVHR